MAAEVEFMPFLLNFDGFKSTLAGNVCSGSKDMQIHQSICWFSRSELPDTDSLSPDYLFSPHTHSQFAVENPLW